MSSTHKQGRTPIHATSFKVAVAREYLTSNMGYGQLAAKYELKLTSVRFFVRWYKNNYPSGEVDVKTVAPHQVLNEQPDLQKQLRQANLKITALEMLIENVQKELGVNIIKKHGTKQ
jgi:hypothetical protein